jgi:Domain of unknown function (DUF4326)
MSDTPKRIQRKRTKGWKMPEGVVYVGRPTKWGNPFRLSDQHSTGEIVRQYREWLSLSLPGEQLKNDSVVELRGKDLACWCPVDQPCHADVLLEIANA